MKTKEIYIRPEIEIVELMSEGVMAASGDNENFTFDGSHSGEAGAKRRGFWD